MSRKFLVALAIVAALGAVVYGAYAWYYSITYVWTDDAYVEGVISPVSAKVTGHVVELLFVDNQPVTRQFLSHGADSFTAERRALLMLYRDTVGQAQVLAYADDFRLFAYLFSVILLLIPLMRRVHAEPIEAAPRGSSEPIRGLPAATE
jgi:hypothetical protein